MTTVERPLRCGSDDSDIPVGLGRDRFPTSSAPIEVGDQEDFVLSLDQPRNQRRLPGAVEVAVRYRGETLLKGQVDPEAFLDDLAKKWRNLLKDPSPEVKIGSLMGNLYATVLVLRRSGVTLTLWATQNGVLKLVCVPFEAALETLEEFGHAIAVRLPADCSAVHAWRERLPRDRNGLATVDAQLLELPLSLVGRLNFEPVTDPRDLAFPGDLRMAARLAYVSEINVEVLRVALDAIRAHAPVDTPALDALGNEALAAKASDLDELRKPYEQGHTVAKWVRNRLALPEGRIDIEGMLRGWGVAIEDIDLGTSLIDAIAAWGDHGPVVIVNRAGKRSGSPRGRRATMAHELCHLLIDRTGALPVAEVQGNRVRTDQTVEARANAFGAELLLPTEVAARTLRQTGDIEMAVEELMDRFDVSRLLALRQMDNYDGDTGGPLPEQKMEIARLIEQSKAGGTDLSRSWR
ncbi:ImmA/IrrE family metallo-endopeptidase [Azospirillum sp. HJ39]|uniref:ImmA/IrrE family metallo-endopeptidase n=1 Tax=Azospirillum sp. HJ39 TaxID=3159496 RepID=UPI0035592496